MNSKLFIVSLVLGLSAVGCVSKSTGSTKNANDVGHIAQDANTLQKIACRVQLDLMSDVCAPAATGKVTELCVKVDGKLGLCAPVLVVDPNTVSPSP